MREFDRLDEKLELCELWELEKLEEEMDEFKLLELE